MSAQGARSVSLCLFSGQGDQLSILLIKRKYPPFVGKYALPGGYLRQEEDANAGIVRKLLKETHIVLGQENLLPLSLRQAASRDPRGPSTHYAFAALIQREQNFPQRWAGETVAECTWMPLLQAPPLAFDHGAIVCEALSLGWPDLIHKMAAPKLPLKFPDSISPKQIKLQEEITFFPGSFNPWHEGHLACLQLCPAKNMMAMVDSNPWKENAPISCRLKLYLTVAQALQDMATCVYPGFAGLEVSNPTVHWLVPYQAKGKWLLMGMDSFLSLPKWLKADSLIKELNGIYVVPRNVANDDFALISQQLQKWNPTIKIEMLPSHAQQGVSSTQLRSNVLEIKKS